ncbi:MAG: hypothetical protein ABIQ60_15610, partial [Burkholderiaceae bacterium]
QRARLFTNSAGYVVDTGGASAFFLTGIPGVTAYLDGMEVLFRVANTVTGVTTINVNGLGSRTVNRTDGTSLQAGDIVSGQIVSLRYSTTTSTFQFFSSSAGAAAGSASASAASATQSAGYRDQSQAYSLQSLSYRDTALTYRDAASGYSSSASGYANSASTYAANAAGSANSAAQSASTASSYAAGGVTSVNSVSGPGAITIPIGVTTFNGSAGAITYTAPVSSVAGRTGIITLTSSDLSNFTSAAAAAAPVQSVAGRTGAVAIGWSDIGSKPTTLAGYGITDAGFALVTSSIQSTFTSLTQVFVVCTYNSGAAYFSLPSSPPDGGRVRVLFTNSRNDNRIYLNSGYTLKVGTTSILSGEYLELDIVSNLVREFVYVSAAGAWEMV